MKKCEYMLKHQDKVFNGTISSVTKFGVFIMLPNMIEGLTHITAMMDDYYNFDEKNIMLVGRRTGKVYRLGDEVIVKVSNVDTDKQEIDFRILKHKSIFKK